MVTRVARELEHDREVIPMVEERAVVLKRKKLTGGLRVRTVVRESEKVIDEPLTTDAVEVERVPVDRWVEAPVPIRQEGEPTIITLEEVAVVEKRLRATEEVRITRRRTVRQASQHVTLRREEAVVERLDAAGRGDNDPD
jgi:stress response protein YsnF